MNINKAKERVEKIRKFYKNLLWFAAISSMIMCRKYFKYGTVDPAVTGGYVLIAIWGFILAVKAVNLFVFDEKWERRLEGKELKKQ